MHNKYDKNSFDQKVYQQKTTIFIKLWFLLKAKQTEMVINRKEYPEKLQYMIQEKIYKFKK